MKLVVIIGLILICATCKKEVADYRDKWCGIYNTKTVYFGKHYFYDSISKDWSSKIGYDTMYGYSILVKDLKYNDGVAIQFSSTIDFNPNTIVSINKKAFINCFSSLRIIVIPLFLTKHYVFNGFFFCKLHPNFKNITYLFKFSFFFSTFPKLIRFYDN